MLDLSLLTCDDAIPEVAWQIIPDMWHLPKHYSLWEGDTFLLKAESGRWQIKAHGVGHPHLLQLRPLCMNQLYVPPNLRPHLTHDNPVVTFNPWCVKYDMGYFINDIQASQSIYLMHRNFQAFAWYYSDVKGAPLQQRGKWCATSALNLSRSGFNRNCGNFSALPRAPHRRIWQSGVACSVTFPVWTSLKVSLDY